MILYYLFVAMINIINGATFFLDPVLALPYGMDNALITFSSTMRAILEVLPFLAVPMATFLLFYSLVVGRFIWLQVKWLIERIH